MVAALALAALPSLPQAEAYCRRLTRAHYENFTVVSLLVPRNLRQHFCNIYAYCRGADDLADEPDQAPLRLARLDDWERQLHACYDEQPQRPVFVALQNTIRQFQIPRQPFQDLLAAFRRDQQQQRYATVAQLLDYCRCSANPVGHLVLYLGHCYDQERADLGDQICTGLQLANFCQDVARDYEQGRIYLPQESWQRFGCDERTFAQRQATGPFRQLLAAEVQRARSYLLAGRPLVERVPDSLRMQLELYVRGGLAILQAIEKQDYDVWSSRPRLNKLAKLRLFPAAWWHTRRRVRAEC